MNHSLDRSFIDELASAAPTPGGGGASAYVGALASALSSMVGNLTINKKKYAAVEDQVKETLDELEMLRDQLIALIDADAQAFAPLAKAYGLPKETPEQAIEKQRVMQEALVGACEVPLSIMRSCAKVIVLSTFLGHHGSRLALSDVGVAALFAGAALKGASLNIVINCSSMTDRDRAQLYLSEAKSLIATYGVQADKLYEFVVSEIG